jgi:hypothetical protein
VERKTFFWTQQENHEVSLWPGGVLIFLIPKRGHQKRNGQINHRNRQIASTQIRMMMEATIHFVFVLIDSACALCLHSSITVFGIIFITIEIPAGTIMRSSICPKTGMKSGMRSIGLMAYPMIKAISALAYQGTLGSLQAR